MTRSVVSDVKFYVPTSNNFCNGGSAGAGRLSSCMRLSGPSWAIKFLYAPAPPPPPHNMCPETSLMGSCTLNLLCTYDLYSLVHNVLDACISITWTIGRGLGPGNLDFLGPKWHSLISLMPFHRAQKSLDFQGKTLSHLPS
jgi:hypothetical protein